MEMPCSGCSDAVNRVLGKMEGEWSAGRDRLERSILAWTKSTRAGIESVEISLADQKVTVKAKAGVTPEAILEKVQKTGKKTEFWS